MKFFSAKAFSLVTAFFVLTLVFSSCEKKEEAAKEPYKIGAVFAVTGRVDGTGPGLVELFNFTDNQPIANSQIVFGNIPQRITTQINFLENIPKKEIKCLQTKSQSTPKSSWVY